MAVIRTVVAELWAGALPVRRLAPGDPAPTVAELDAIATAMTAQNDGVRPNVRVLEQFPSLRALGTGYGGTPGSVPR